MKSAYCGATAALGEAGILDERPHTSNSFEYLTLFCSNYIRKNISPGRLCRTII
ncbi:hypothetical protein [Paenibacillus sp. TH7-28]